MPRQAVEGASESSRPRFEFWNPQVPSDALFLILFHLSNENNDSFLLPRVVLKMKYIWERSSEVLGA